MSGSALFFCLPCLSQTISQLARLMSEAVSYTKYGLHTADFAASRILPLRSYSQPRTTDCPTFRTGTAATTTHGCRDCQSCNRDDQRSSTRLRLSHPVVIAPVDESARKTATTLPTGLHHMSKQYQRDSGCAALGVSVIFVSGHGCCCA